MSYSQATGFFAREDANRIEESSVMMRIDPYNYLNERNAIMLNCKNPQPFNNVYEQALEKHFKKQMASVSEEKLSVHGSNPIIEALTEEINLQDDQDEEVKVEQDARV